MKKYEDWKEGLPGTEWIRDLLPSDQQWQEFRSTLIDFKDTFANNLELGKLSLIFLSKGSNN